MSIDQITPEALKLPVRERVLLASCLWESLGDPFLMPSEEEDEEAIALALKRDAELESGVSNPVSHAEMMAFLRS